MLSQSSLQPAQVPRAVATAVLWEDAVVSWSICAAQASFEISKPLIAKAQDPLSRHILPEPRPSICFVKMLLDPSNQQHVSRRKPGVQLWKLEGGSTAAHCTQNCCIPLNFLTSRQCLCSCRHALSCPFSKEDQSRALIPNNSHYKMGRGWLENSVGTDYNLTTK